MCLFLLKVFIIIIAVVNMFVVYSLYYKQEPLFPSPALERQFFDVTPYSNFRFFKLKSLGKILTIWQIFKILLGDSRSHPQMQKIVWCCFSCVYNTPIVFVSE